MSFESVSQAQTYVQYGKASFYAKKFNGRRTTSGERYSNSEMTAAHRTLPFNSIVRVTNLDNNKSVEVRINDRGPKSHKRIIDVSRKAAKELDIIKQGIGNVKVEVVLLYRSRADSDSIILQAKMAQHAIDTTIFPDTARLNKSQWYKVSVTDVDPVGYGIQVGSFSLYTNMMKEIDTLQNMFPYSILVQNIRINDQIFYRVILGPFESKVIAQQVMLEIKKKKIQGFILLLKP
jgi:rare lipoprotein A